MLVTGCATTPAPAPVIGPTIGTTHAAQTGTIRALSSSVPEAPVPPPEAQYLLTATDELDTEYAESDHVHVVRALHALVDALEVIAPERADDILRLRETTNELGRLDLEATSHAELARIALDAATRALEHVKPWAERDRHRLTDAVVAMQGATDQINPKQPLIEQARALRSAFRASVRAVYAATGAPEPEIAATPTATR